MKRIIILLALFAITAHAERLTFSDRFKITTPSDPQISPDGKSIAFVVTRANTKENRFDSDLVLFDLDGGTQRPLTFERRGVTQPRWSPDGTQIAFLAMAGAEKDAKRQIWVLSVRGGDARRLTDAPQSVQQYAWSPDGSTFAFVTADEPEKKTDTDKFNKSFEVGDDDFLINALPMSSHVWTIPSAGGTAKRITSGQWSLPIAHPPGPVPSPLSWSPDGKSIAIAQLAGPRSGMGQTSRVSIVDLASGTVRRVTTAEVGESHPVFSPDGRSIVYMHPLGGERMNETHIWLAPVSGGAGRDVTTGIDHNLVRAIWMPDGKSFLVGAHNATTTSYWIQPIDGSPRKLDLGGVEPWNGFWIDANVSRSGAIAFTGSTSDRPRELYSMDSPDAKPRRLSNYNDRFPSLQLGRVETITWKNDGFDEDGVLTTPPDFDASKKYPLVVYIHGGPRSATTTGFAWLPQLFAAQGWVVFQPNYRGSDNYGNAYTRAIVGDAGAGPGRDVMAGITAVKKRGFIDEDKIVVGGWSYGGYMTNWMISHYSIFKAAVAGAAVNNWLDQYTLGDSNVQRAYAMGGSPYVGDNMKKYIDQSPITYASKIRTPTLILSDMGDVRVPVTQSFQMYHALRDNNVPVKFIAYPVSGHSPDDPIHQSDIDHRYVEWFSQYLK
ncbi:MAG TPA: S9 family peptidase [Thermoanaerobaculia bacterium]|jgi:dipeptidyl aminopeptidase/acylaminoacyl peptidase|nr:S9 family peptidase [Thermoanaerobaculia bacterium]